METRTLKALSIIIVVTLIAVLTASAYNGRAGNNANNQSSATCVNRIPGLTQSQTEAITALEVKHQKIMDQFRSERRSTTDEKTKAEIRIKMINTRDAHRAEVNKLLTPEQQTAYESLHAKGNNHQYAQDKKGKGKGNCSGSCRKR
jgi:hypothetical protein